MPDGRVYICSGPHNCDPPLQTPLRRLGLGGETAANFVNHSLRFLFDLVQMHNGKILIMGFQGYNSDFLITLVSKIDSLITI